MCRVMYSYRTLNRQEVLDKETVTTNISKGKVQSYLQEQEEYFKKKREKESLKMRMGLLQRQILQQEKLEKEGKGETIPCNIQEGERGGGEGGG